MTRAAFIAAGLLLACTQAWATNACQRLIKSERLPSEFKLLTRAKLRPAELVILSNGQCTCNDTPAVQRGLGQSQPGGVFWASDGADADDTKAK